MSCCDTVKDCFKQVAMCLYSQPIVKSTVMSLFLMYDNYCESQETVELIAEGEMAEPEFDLDDLLSELEGEENLKLE